MPPSSSNLDQRSLGLSRLELKAEHWWVWQAGTHDVLMQVERIFVAEDGMDEDMLVVLGTVDTMGTGAGAGLTEVDQEVEEEVMGEILSWCRWRHWENLDVNDTLSSVG